MNKFGDVQCVYQYDKTVMFLSYTHDLNFHPPYTTTTTHSMVILQLHVCVFTAHTYILERVKPTPYIMCHLCFRLFGQSSLCITSGKRTTKSIRILLYSFVYSRTCFVTLWCLSQKWGSAGINRVLC